MILGRTECSTAEGWGMLGTAGVRPSVCPAAGGIPERWWCKWSHSEVTLSNWKQNWLPERARAAVLARWNRFASDLLKTVSTCALSNTITAREGGLALPAPRRNFPLLHSLLPSHPVNLNRSSAWSLRDTLVLRANVKTNLSGRAEPPRVPVDEQRSGAAAEPAFAGSGIFNVL